MNKYFICFKPKNDLYQHLKDISRGIKNKNPNIQLLHEKELLHLTMHKPIEGDYKEILSSFIKEISKDFSKTRIILNGYSIFEDNFVVRVHPTYHLASLWVKVREFVKKISNDVGNEDDMLHFTLFKNIPNKYCVIFPESIEGISLLDDQEYPFEYICLFEKEPGQKWVEIQRLPIG